MFTGLVEATGILHKRLEKDNGLALYIELPFAGEMTIGDSLAVNGCCLTVEEIDAKIIRFHVLNETLSKTNLGTIKEGQKVNLERPLKLGDRLDGHMVSGHVDLITSVKEIKEDGDIQFSINLSNEMKALVIPKGSITIDGISLTIAQLDDEKLTVCLIPHTWNITNLNEKSTGDLVNIELDMIAKYVQRQNFYT